MSSPYALPFATLGKGELSSDVIGGILLWKYSLEKLCHLFLRQSTLGRISTANKGSLSLSLTALYRAPCVGTLGDETEPVMLPVYLTIVKMTSDITVTCDRNIYYQTPPCK